MKVTKRLWMLLGMLMILTSCGKSDTSEALKKKVHTWQYAKYIIIYDDAGGRAEEYSNINNTYLVLMYSYDNGTNHLCVHYHIKDDDMNHPIQIDYDLSYGLGYKYKASVYETFGVSDSCPCRFEW